MKLGCFDVFATVLTAIFVAAKLFGTIDWSWWLVLSPVWIYIGIVALIILALGD